MKTFSRTGLLSGNWVLCYWISIIREWFQSLLDYHSRSKEFIGIISTPNPRWNQLKLSLLSLFNLYTHAIWLKLIWRETLTIKLKRHHKGHMQLYLFIYLFIHWHIHKIHMDHQCWIRAWCKQWDLEMERPSSPWRMCVLEKLMDRTCVDRTQQNMNYAKVESER